MQATIERARDSGGQFTVLSIDLDGFKETNDTYGHLIGDALLSEVSRRFLGAAGSRLCRAGWRR